MTIHIIKLSVGPETLTDLVDWQQERLKEMKRRKQTPELMHVTRQMPKRAEEVLAGGSIYWVIKGYIVGRQKLLELRALDRDGVPYCGLVMDKQMTLVQPRPRRPFQGWRYFEPDDAPADIGPYTKDYQPPDELQRELMAMGLI